MATNTVTHNGIEYFGIATYKNVNDIIGYESFKNETNRCLSDTVANDKNFIGYPDKPTNDGKLLAFVNLNLLKKITLTIKTNPGNVNGIRLNWIKIHYLRKQNNTSYQTVRTDTVFESAWVWGTKTASTDIVSPHENDMAIYGELGVPVTQKAVKIEISPYIIYGDGTGVVNWSTDTNTTGTTLGSISNNSTFSYTFDLAWVDSTTILPTVNIINNEFWKPATSSCTITFALRGDN